MNNIKNEIKLIEMTSRQNRKDNRDSFICAIGTIALFFFLLIMGLIFFTSCTKSGYDSECFNCNDEASQKIYIMAFKYSDYTPFYSEYYGKVDCCTECYKKVRRQLLNIECIVCGNELIYYPLDYYGGHKSSTCSSCKHIHQAITEEKYHSLRLRDPYDNPYD